MIATLGVLGNAASPAEAAAVMRFLDDDRVAVRARAVEALAPRAAREHGVGSR